MVRADRSKPTVERPAFFALNGPALQFDGTPNLSAVCHNGFERIESAQILFLVT